MDVLIDKQYESYDYRCRYSHVPYYYNTLDNKEIYGLGSNVDKSTTYTSHKVKQGDTLDGLALTYYGNPTFQQCIAYFNDIQDAFIDLNNKFDIIKIPLITGLTFKAER